MRPYLALMQDVLTNGERKDDRTGTGTISVFGRTLRFNLQQGFPLVTTKRTFWRGAFIEMLWMVSGDTNVKKLQEQAVTIWDEWADENGNLGPVYGYQWRQWTSIKEEQFMTGGKVDQLACVIADLVRVPHSRRHLVSAWNVGDLGRMKLPPCHYAYQFYVRNGKYLDCMVQMRSVDVFLGLPFDIAGYALLTHMVARVTGYQAGELIFNLGDTHIYLNHIEQCLEQLKRVPKELPRLLIDARNISTIDDFKFENFTLVGYEPHPAIKGDVSV